jgi:uncharacterized phage infection (PIP) family protein YhgE
MPSSASTDRSRTAPDAKGRARGLSVDELAAQRNTPPLPPEPVFTIDLVEVETESGKRGRKYVADLEELAQRNARAAEEARALALEQRRHLEEATDGRRAAERKIAALNRELQAAVAEQQRLELRNRTRATAPVGPSVVPDAATGSSEVANLREAVEQQQRLLGEGRERLASALRERDAARLDARQAMEARDRAKRSLHRATDLLHEHACGEIDGDSTPTDIAVDPQTTADLRAARLGAEARLLRVTDELDRMTAHAEDLEVRVAAETVRADDAEARVDELAVSARSADGESASARDQLTAALARERDLERTHDRLTARVGELEAGAARRTDELETARQLVADLRAQVDRLTSNAGTATAALAEADQIAAERARALETVATEHAHAVDDLAEQLAETVEERDGLRSFADAATARVAALEADVAAAADELDNVRRQLVDLATAAEDRLRKAIAERDDARGQVLDLTAAGEVRATELDRVAMRIATRDAELLRLTDEQAALDTALHQARDEVAAGAREIARLTEQGAGLAAVAPVAPVASEPPTAPTPAAAGPPSRDTLRELRSELSDVNTLDAESRRSLLSDLSDLADANPPPSAP